MYWRKDFKKGLVMWKRQYLSKGSRLTLVKSTQSSLPICYISLFVILRKASLGLQTRPHLVKRLTICMEKRDGGLGIKSLSNSKQDPPWKGC